MNDSHDPSIEALPQVIEHFNRGRMAGIEEMGYFVYDGVKVYAPGRRDEAQKRDAITTEERAFGGKK